MAVVNPLPRGLVHLPIVVLTTMAAALLALSAPSIPSEGLGGLIRIFEPVVSGVLALVLLVILRLVLKRWVLWLTALFCVVVLADGIYIHFHPWGGWIPLID